MRLTPASGTITHTRLCAEFGAVVQGIDLATVGADAFRRLYQLWQGHHLLVLRDQHLTSAQFRRLAAMLGDQEPARVDSDATTEWHSDMPWLERPPFASLLWAEQAPCNGAGMWFASMPAALRSMPPDLVARLGNLPLRHGPSTVHPLVVMQPETGEPSLYLGRRKDTCIPGVQHAESDRLLNILWSYATATAVSVRHHWQTGDVLLWNNLTTIHRVEAVPAAGARVHVTRIKGRYTLSAPIQQEAA